MKGKSTLFFIFIAIVLVIPQANSFDLPLSSYDGGVYKIQISARWNIYTAGQCGELAFVARDRENKLNQVFFFGSIGPVYMSQEQKQIDWNYMNMGGYPVAWIEMPVINPLTPENFMLHFSEIAATQIAQQFMPQAPRLKKFKTISITQRASMIQGGKTEILRALFTKQKKVGEGMFLCTVAPFMPFTGGPGGGNGYGFMVSGVTAAKSQFSKILPILVKSIGSLKVNPEYVNQCIQASNAAFQQVMRSSQTLQETSDLIMKGWQNRNKKYDIMAEKHSDAILGFERVYDPDTKETYQINPQFWEDYKLNKQRFRMNNLQVIPDNDYRLWNKAPKPQQEIR
jgi:hypothetical protein